MNIYATKKAEEAWNSLRSRERARTLAATYFAPMALVNAFERDSEYKKKAVNAIAGAAELESYYAHWQRFVDSLPAESCRQVQAVLQGRLLVNLSGSILEGAGLSLEHVCGVPVIPGSAVKGAARRYAIALLQECEPAQKESLLESFISIFGCVEQDFEAGSDLALVLEPALLRELGELYGKRRGCVSFLQAVPGNPVRICADVLTPHHQKYMSGEKPEPADDEDPVPSFFPAVQGGADAAYTFALYALGHPELLDTAEEWLSQALALFGIGAKGAAGYGFFSIPDKALLGFTREQQQGIIYIRIKGKLRDMFAQFHKQKEKDLWNYWALLRAISLPESDSDCRLKDFREFLEKVPTEKKEMKARTKALEAMQLMAREYNFNLPLIP